MAACPHASTILLRRSTACFIGSGSQFYCRYLSAAAKRSHATSVSSVGRFSSSSLLNSDEPTARDYAQQRTAILAAEIESLTEKIGSIMCTSSSLSNSDEPTARDYAQQHTAILAAEIESLTEKIGSIMCKELIKGKMEEPPPIEEVVVVKEKHPLPKNIMSKSEELNREAQTGAVIPTISSCSTGQNTSIKSDTKNVKARKPVRKPVQGNGYDDGKLVEMIESVIVDRSPCVKWDDIAGLEKAKQTLLEMVVLPTKRKDIFTGLRRTSRGLLLFGPPGTGKTMLAKAVASESEATFFNVSASSLTSKWVGESEKLVRTLFTVAISRKPSVIFIDEIDSIMSTRTSSESGGSRRLKKSEFLVQFDGVTSNSDDLVIVIGATNKPQDLDDAVLRRLVKRIYIPLPDANVRRNLFEHKLKGQAFSLPGGDLERLVRETEGYSGSDLQALCQEAAMMPIRELGSKILTIKANQVRSLKYSDFQSAMTVIRPCLQKSKWEELQQWNKNFGSN